MSKKHYTHLSKKGRAMIERMRRERKNMRFFLYTFRANSVHRSRLIMAVSSAAQKAAEKLDCQTHFATLYHSWEKSTNETANRLIRKYPPKGMSFRNLTKQIIKKEII